ncbi:hypothetical protein IMZ48_26580 [Candidatus Bathyarchaeota archaeon]|nr:hypothetical protein [Candidatus Bathyarchaeota archaeon]
MRRYTFEPNDPGNPKNWTLAMKRYCTFVVAITCFTAPMHVLPTLTAVEGPASSTTERRSSGGGGEEAVTNKT